MRKKQKPLTIRTQGDIEIGIEALIAADPRLQSVHQVAGALALRDRVPDFQGLSWIIISQQLSVASANAIWARALKTIDPFQPNNLLTASDEMLRKAGLSAPKIRALRALSLAVIEGTVNFTALETAKSEEAYAMLTKVKGIGPWTADIYLLFCLGHANAFPAGDLALQEAARIAFGLRDRPTAADLLVMAEVWRPWRGIAARLLWAYYGAMKGQSGISLTKESVP